MYNESELDCYNKYYRSGHEQGLRGEAFARIIGAYSRLQNSKREVCPDTEHKNQETCMNFIASGPYKDKTIGITSSHVYVDGEQATIRGLADIYGMSKDCMRYRLQAVRGKPGLGIVHLEKARSNSGAINRETEVELQKLINSGKPEFSSSCESVSFL
jgi:hypothetical protein